MRYNPTYPSSEEEKDLAYDLRQGYAEIIMIHWKDVILNRKLKNLPKYFEALDDLHTVIKHKFRKENDELEYLKLKSSAIELFNNNPSVYFGRAVNDDTFGAMMGKLKEIEMFLWKKTDEVNIYGSKWDEEGL